MTRARRSCYGVGMSLEADRVAIDEQITRYCRAIDTGDWDLLDSIFTSDAVLDYTSSGGTRGPFPEMKAWLASVLPNFAVRQHLVTNREITIDGDTATSRSSLLNPMGMRRDDGGLDLFITGATYHDRWTRTADGWRMTERRLDEHWRDVRAQR
jgi:hypothetical protein